MMKIASLQSDDVAVLIPGLNCDCQCSSSWASLSSLIIVYLCIAKLLLYCNTTTWGDQSGLSMNFSCLWPLCCCTTWIFNGFLHMQFTFRYYSCFQIRVKMQPLHAPATNCSLMLPLCLAKTTMHEPPCSSCTIDSTSLRWWDFSLMIHLCDWLIRVILHTLDRLLPMSTPIYLSFGLCSQGCVAICPQFNKCPSQIDWWNQARHSAWMILLLPPFFSLISQAYWSPIHIVITCNLKTDSGFGLISCTVWIKLPGRHSLE